MARRNDGFFNKLLNIVGIVDDEDPRDSYEENDYDRPSTYVPAHERQSTRQRQERQMTRRNESAYQPTRSERRYEPNRPSTRVPERRSTAAPTPRRGAFVERVEEERPRYDYSPRPAAPSRFGGLDEHEETMPARRQDNRGGRGRGGRNRTVMYTLHTLGDCTEVIDELIANNTVILTLDDLNPQLMQRAVDTLSGAVFALHATIRKASDRTYLIAPASVEVNDLYDTDDRF